jgi:hypothetical protein
MKRIGEIKARLARRVLRWLYVPYESQAAWHMGGGTVRTRTLYRNKAEARRDALHMMIFKHPIGRRVLVWLIEAAGPPVRATSERSSPKSARRS